VKDYELKKKAELDSLQEIIGLMDEAKVDKLKSLKKPKAVEIEVESVGVAPMEAEGEEPEAPMPGKDEMSPEDKMKLQELYSKYCG
jgi:hypothetical protein